MQGCEQCYEVINTQKNKQQEPQGFPRGSNFIVTPSIPRVQKL